MSKRCYSFVPAEHEDRLLPLLSELAQLSDDAAGVPQEVERLVRRFPKTRGGFFSRSEIVQGFRYFRHRLGDDDDVAANVARFRMKPVRTLSGVAPVTVLTLPYPCPGRCIFCPSDVRMPKSYLADEPGAQRAAQHRFDPYRQTASRLRALVNMGHPTDKIELIILGGTWSAYPEAYQVWFVRRCFEAMNEFDAADDSRSSAPLSELDFRNIGIELDGRCLERSYNEVVLDFLAGETGAWSDAESEWRDLDEQHVANESAAARCVGLVVETRPDHLTLAEAVRIRRLGATKVQIGLQSLSDEVLSLNRRGHTVDQARRAIGLLRRAGFKIHAHWMPNLYGSSPARDLDDFRRLFADPDFRPDELKIYPCSLIASAELMRFYEDGRWRPYEQDELLELVTACLAETPEYCRVTRVIRDIPGTDIVVGNKTTNFRQLAERELARRGLAGRDIRSREVRDCRLDPSEVTLREVDYTTAVGRELFLAAETADDRLAGFLRLSLPERPDSAGVPGSEGSAMIREVHVYGQMVALGESPVGSAQHGGLGGRMIARAAELATTAGYPRLAVISAVGTRGYYRRLGFQDRELYQVRPLGPAVSATAADRLPAKEAFR